MQRLFLFILLCLISFSTKARDTLVTQNLRHLWISMDSRGNLSPYTSGDFSELIFFELAESGQGEYLLLKSEKAIDVWLNNELIFLQFDSAVVLDLDSLNSEKREKLRFKIFSAGGIDESLVTQKIQMGIFTEAELANVSQRPLSVKNDLYIITLSIILLLAGMFRRFFPAVFRQSIQNPLSLKVRSATDRTYESFGSADNLFSVFFLGAISTLFFTYLDYELVLYSGERVIEGLINWLLISLAIMLLVLLKYLWAKLISLLYQYREVPNIQNQDFIRFFTLVMLLGLLLTLVDFTLFNATSWFRNLTIYLVLLSLLFFQVWFFRKFDKRYSHKKLMIISYLCTTEFLPGFLAIYWLVKM